MRIVVGIALYESLRRTKSVVESLRGLKSFDDLLFVFVNTGSYQPEMVREVESLSNSVFVHKPLGGRVGYLNVMKAKLEVVGKYAGLGDVYYNADDDYIFSPYLFETIRRIDIPSSMMAYFTFLKLPIPYDINESEIVDRAGIRFLNVGSAMGGSVCAEANRFFVNLEDYLCFVRPDPMFDRGFWEYINGLMGERSVWMTHDHSLCQHMNFGSNYMESKKSANDHQFGLDYSCHDPWGEE